MLNGFGFSKQLKLNPDKIYISNMLSVWKTKFAVSIVRFPLFYFSLENIQSCAVFNISWYHIQYFWTKNSSEFRPYWLLLAELLRNLVCDLRLYLRSSLIWNILFIICVEMFCLTLNNSMAKDCIFLWWTVKDWSILKKSLYEQYEQFQQFL